MGASTPAIASAAATRWVDERRGCRIAMSPRVASHALSAGFSPLYGKKKGASAPVGLAPAAGLVEWGATKIAGAIMDDNLLSPPTSAGRTHQSESAQEKAAPGAGRMRAGTASVRNTDLQFTAKICGGRLLQRHPDIGCMLQRHDAIRPAVDEAPLSIFSASPLPGARGR